MKALAVREEMSWTSLIAAFGENGIFAILTRERRIANAILCTMLTFRTAGESHGQALIALIEGLPAHLEIDFDFIYNELKRRQGGYGRGGRMKIETDRARILSGVRHGETIGSPVA